MPRNFFNRLRRRAPVVVSPGQDAAYCPESDGDALLGTDADRLAAYLRTQPRRLAALEASCTPLRQRIRELQADEDPTGDVVRMLSHSVRAAAANAPTIWDAVFTDLVEATHGGPGITVNPLAVLMSRSVSRSVFGLEAEGLLYVSSEARRVADRLLEVIPGFGEVVDDLMAISRATVAARAVQAGVSSVLVHRRFRMTEAMDAVLAHQLDKTPAPDLVRRVADEIDFLPLSLWSTDIRVARDWSRAADPSSTSVVILSGRVPISSIWMAPRRQARELLISAEALMPEHSEVLHRD